MQWPSGGTQERAFSDGQVTLLQTLADQAVIAIENARLFDEVQARNRDLTALGEVGRTVSSTLDLKKVLKTIVDRAVELSGTDGARFSTFATAASSSARPPASTKKSSPSTANSILLLGRLVSVRRLPGKSHCRCQTSSTDPATLFAMLQSQLGSARRSSCRYSAEMVRLERYSSNGVSGVTSNHRLSALCNPSPTVGHRARERSPVR